MVDRSSIHTPDPDPDKTESEGVAAPLLQKEEVPETNINDPPVIGVHPPSTPASTKEQNNSPSVQGPRRRPRSQQSSRSGSGSGSGSASDLELDEMRHADPAYSAANGRSSEETVKLDTSRGGWTDGIFERDDPEDDLDHDSKEARRLGSKQFIEKTAINVTLIAAWYILSISMSVYNKWMFSAGKNLDFHYPLFTTSVHMIVQWILASLVLLGFPFLRPQYGGIAEHPDPERNPRAPPPSLDPSKPIMTLWFYITRIASCGTVTGLDIGLGNTSLKFISLTFFTMCKSSTLGFVLLFAILFRLEAPSLKIFSIIAVMTIGVIMMVAGETAFSAIGFVLLMLASFFSGLRWSLTQILLRRTPATSNPFSTLFFLTPVMFVVLFILAVPVEGFHALKLGLDRLAEQKGLALGIAIVLFPGCIAFCMTAAEFALLKRTSVVTLSVCGIFKEVLTITAAGFIFGDELTPINISGLLITIAAIAVYNVTRMRKMRRKEMTKAQERWDEAHSPMLDRDGNLIGTVPVVGGDARPSRDLQGRSSAERLGSATGLMPNGAPSVPAALVKVKRRGNGEYEEVEQDDRDR